MSSYTTWIACQERFRAYRFEDDARCIKAARERGETIEEYKSYVITLIEEESRRRFSPANVPAGFHLEIMRRAAERVLERVNSTKAARPLPRKAGVPIEDKRQQLRARERRARKSA